MRNFDNEIKIDKLGYGVCKRNLGSRTTEPHHHQPKPLCMKIRNICGVKPIGRLMKHRHSMVTNMIF